MRIAIRSRSLRHHRHVNADVSDKKLTLSLTLDRENIET